MTTTPSDLPPHGTYRLRVSTGAEINTPGQYCLYVVAAYEDGSVDGSWDVDTATADHPSMLDLPAYRTYVSALLDVDEDSWESVGQLVDRPDPDDPYGGWTIEEVTIGNAS